MLLVAIAIAIPASAHANRVDVSAQAELTAKANADTSKAVKAVKESKAQARKHLARARASMKRAYRMTQRVNAKAARTGDVPSSASVTARFTAAVDANNEKLETLVERSNGRIETQAGRAMAENVAMRSRALLASLKSYEQADPGVDPEDFQVDDQIAVHAEAFAEVSGFADGREVGNRARARIAQGMAKVLDVQTQIAERFGELYRQSSSQGKQKLAELRDKLAQETSSMRSSVEDSGLADAEVRSSEQGDTTLVELAVSVETEVRTGVEHDAGVQAHGEARGTGTISLPQLP